MDNEKDNADCKANIGGIVGELKAIRKAALDVREIITSIIELNSRYGISIKIDPFINQLNASKQKIDPCINECLNSFSKIRGSKSERCEYFYRQFEGEVNSINFFLINIKAIWDKMGDIKVDTIDNNLDNLRQMIYQLDKIIFTISWILVPDSLSKHLDTMKIGEYIDFNDMFRDDIPSDKDREEIFNRLFRGSININGIIDISKKRIYKASKSWRRQAESLVIIAAGIAACAIIVYALPILPLEAEDWPWKGDTSKELLIAYFFVLLGSLAHVAVDLIKQRRSGETRLALNDLLLWINIKEVPLLLSILALFIGFIGLSISKNIEWQTALFAGYSIDSVVDVLIQRFDTAVSTKTKIIRSN